MNFATLTVRIEVPAPEVLTTLQSETYIAIIRYRWRLVEKQSGFAMDCKQDEIDGKCQMMACETILIHTRNCLDQFCIYQVAMCPYEPYKKFAICKIFNFFKKI